jgi:exopolysaccharide biosynthesis WecB/TagA/CpsF family protein
MDSVRFLGLDFCRLSPADLLDRPLELTFAYLVTPNADHFARLARQPALRGVYEAASWRVLDSKVLALLAGRRGMLVPAVVTGADFCAALLPCLAGQTVAVIGMEAKNFGALRARYPGVQFVHHAPPMGLLHRPADFAAAVDFAVQARARMTFLALGSPLQEILAHEIAQQSGARGVGLCIGSALDFCAGTKRRAPLWMQRAGLEWAHRLACEPRRLVRRYLWDDVGVVWGLVAGRGRKGG